jgi:catechol-2,3-dioxygenase
MTSVTEIDHSVLAVEDLIRAEHFYSAVLGEFLGGSVEDRSMLTTDEIIRGMRLRAVMAEREHQSGRSAEAPQRVSAPHSSVKVGEALIPLFLYQEHVQEPPPEQMRGTPRLALQVTPELMEKAIDVFHRHKVPFEGPVDHPSPSPVACSIYFKDPSSNFLELACPRE